MMIYSRFRFENIDIPLWETSTVCEEDIVLSKMSDDDGGLPFFATADEVLKVMIGPAGNSLKLTFVQCIEDRCFPQMMNLDESSKVVDVRLKDVDGDGNTDLVLGLRSGAVHYFKGVK